MIVFKIRRFGGEILKDHVARLYPSVSDGNRHDSTKGLRAGLPIDKPISVIHRLERKDRACVTSC